MSAARTIAGAVVASALTVTLAGCTSKPNPPEPDPSPSSTSGPATPTAAPVELELGVYGDERHLQAYREIAEAFEAQNPEVTVTLEEYSDAAEAAATAVVGLKTGTAPDVFLAHQKFLPQLVETGGLEPVDTLLEERGVQFGDDYQRVALTSLSADNRLQCMPAEMSPTVVYLNRRLVPRRLLAAQEVVVPNRVETSWTWADFVTTARTVAGLDQLGTIKGVYLPPDVETLTALLRSAGGGVVDEVFDPSSLTLSDDDSLETIGELVTLARDPAVAPTADELETRDALTRFTDGELGLLVGTRDDLPELRAAERLRFDVAPLPSFGRARSVSDVNGYCIDASTEHLAAAADFVAFAVGEEASAIAAESDVIVPARVETVADDVFRQPGEMPRNSQVFGTSVRRSEPLPHDQAWPAVEALVEQTLSRLFHRPDLDVAQVLERRMVNLEEQSRMMFEQAD